MWEFVLGGYGGGYFESCRVASLTNINALPPPAVISLLHVSRVMMWQGSLALVIDLCHTSRATHYHVWLMACYQAQPERCAISRTCEMFHNVCYANYLGLSWTHALPAACPTCCMPCAACPVPERL